MTIGLTRRQFAERLGCSPGWVQALVNAGRCVLTPDGKIDGDASVARIAATADPGRRDVAERHAAARQAAGKAVDRDMARRSAPRVLSDLPDLAESGEDTAATGSRAEAKADLMRYENALMKIDQEKRKGLRFDLAIVKRESYALGALIDAERGRLIDQTAPRIAATDDLVQRQNIIDREIRRLRRVVKREMPRAMRRMLEASAKRIEGGV
jgi:hypothetical protein